MQISSSIASLDFYTSSELSGRALSVLYCYPPSNFIEFLFSITIAVNMILKSKVNDPGENLEPRSNRMAASLDTSLYKIGSKASLNNYRKKFSYFNLRWLTNFMHIWQFPKQNCNILNI